MEGLVLIVLITFWLVCGVGAGMIAESKGRRFLQWTVAALLIGPIVLLVIGFMAPPNDKPVDLIVTSPDEIVFYAEGNIAVSNHRLVVDDVTYSINGMRRVEAKLRADQKYFIEVCDNTGAVLETLVSEDSDVTNRVVTAINQAIQMSTPSTPSTTGDNSQALTEIKQLLDAGMVTQEEYERKRADILSRI